MGRRGACGRRLTALDNVLAGAQRRGWLGPAPLAEHRRHAEAFASVVSTPARALDLGTGGGLPGLVLAAMWPDAEVVFVESDRARASFLEAALVELDLLPRVSVLHDRAETAGHDHTLRGQFDVVTARSFGAPAAVAECGAPFLRVGGVLVVSDPPEGAGDRWPPERLVALGLAPTSVPSRDRAQLTVLEQLTPCPVRFPRRPGVPRRRPLF